MDRSYVAKNDVERVRLKALVAGLSDEEMAHPISPKWTVSVALSHIAFWDRLWVAKFEEWERTGVVQIPQLGDAVSGMNDGMLPWWRNIVPAQVKFETIAAAEAVDNKAASLPEPVVQAILAVRPRTLIRAIHRREHLDRIEQALAGLRRPPG